ncbi:GIY-YIG nuclease family protein [Nostoc sp.]|uniref:GIY-YIG nuclease family protein n=1 Tax=Nostoc sp. TaxID=1180 RepID=UPI002FF80E3B
MDLTAIDPLKLPSLPLEKKADLPDCPTIYFAISGSEEILYIGRTADLARRWISHHRFKQLIARKSPKSSSKKIVYVPYWSLD